MKVLAIVLSVLGAIVVVSTIIYNTTIRDYPGGDTPIAEKRVNLKGIDMPLPEGWQVRSEAGVAYAYTLPCSTTTCNNIAVYDETKIKGGDWKGIVDTYKCFANPKETPSKITPRGNPVIGDRGTSYYTTNLCGQSGTETIGIWYAPLPPRVVVAYTSPPRGLPGLQARLNKAKWTV